MIRDLLRVFAVYAGVATGFFTALGIVGMIQNRLEDLRHRQRALRVTLDGLAPASWPSVPDGDVREAFYFPTGDREAMLAILRTMAPRASEN